ncbi:MAG: hypothetical protein ACTHOU_11650 [Aureliella sp.]
MSSDQTLSAVDWAPFVERYQALTPGDNSEYDLLGDHDIEVESLSFNYGIGRCIAEELDDFRTKLPKDQLYYLHHLLYLVFPHYLADVPIADERFAPDQIAVFDAEPPAHHREQIPCMLNPATVRTASQLFAKLDMDLLRRVCEETWHGSDYFHSASEIVDFIQELGDFFTAVASKSGGVIGDVWS